MPEKNFDDGSGFEDFLTKRESRKSTVGIVVTTDGLRIEEYKDKFEQLLANCVIRQKKGERIETPVRLYYLDLFTGIHQVEIEVEGDPRDEENLAIDTKLVPVGGDGDAIAPLEVTLPIMAGLLKDKEYRTFCVMSGLINQESTKNLLEIFVSNICLDCNMFRSGSAVCIIVPDSSILPQSVVSNSYVIRPQPSTKDERKQLMNEVFDYHKRFYEKDCKAKGITPKNPPTLTDKEPQLYLDITDGLNKNDFQSALMESLIRNGKEKIRFDDIIQSKTEIVNSLRGVHIEMLDRASGFDEVGGYHQIKDYFIRKIVNVYNNYELAQKMNVQIPRGILLFGPPGTGKTHLTRQLAKALNCVFIEIMPDQLLGKYVGESEGALNELLNRIDAMGEKVVVFYDELDSQGSRSDSGSDGHVHDNMFSQLLKWLSDPKRKAVVVGATNKPKKIDPAFIRDQRFDKLIYMGPPDESARIEIFQIKFRKTGVELAKDVDIGELAKATVWYSGANIEGIVKEAQTLAFERVLNTKAKRIQITKEDVDRAMEVKRKNVDAIAAMNREYVEIAYELCDDKSLIVTLEDEKKATIGTARAKGGRLND